MADERTDLEKALTPEESAIMRPFATPRLGGQYDYGYGNEQGGGIHLREVMRIIRKRKWLVALIVAVATLLVTIEVFRTPSIYQAKGQLEVTKDSSVVVKTKDQAIQFEDSDSLKTKKIIFKSRPMLEDVVVILQLDRNPKFLEGMQKKSATDALRDIGSRFFGKGKTLEEDSKQEEEVIASQSVLLQERTPQESQKLEPYVRLLRNKLEVEAQEQASVLDVTFEHTDPALAALIVNTAINNFIKRSFDRRTSRFSSTSDWLESSTRELKARVQQAEGALAEFTRRNEMFTTDGKQSLSGEKLSALSAQAVKAETDRMLKETLYNEVDKGNIDKLPEAFSDVKTNTLKQKLGELQVEQSQLSVKYGPENPLVAQVEQKIKVLQTQIAENTETLKAKLSADYQRARRDESEMKKALDSAKAEAVQQNQAAITVGTLQAEYETAKSMYTDFLNKTKQAGLQLAEQSDNLKIVETAEIPRTPIGPQRFRTMLIGLLVSLIAGVGLAFFLEYLDNTVKSVEDIERVAQLPTLAVIPSISTISARALAAGKKKQVLAADAPVMSNAISPNFASAGVGEHGKLTKLVTLDQLSSVVEAYRMLRTSVLLSAAGSPPKIILFTSGQPGEGKTTTAINTAISLSQLGSSVLLIDADLRRPTVHRVFKMGQSQGLSTFLSRQVDIDSLVHRLWVPNLSVLPCGPIPPNPAELISSDRMKGLLKMLSEKYDHILIDSPPLTNVTDPVILSTMVDGVILVVQAGRSTRDIVRRSRQELSSVGAKIFGVVLNNLDIKREGYDSYLSTYGNYGYTETRQASRR